MSKVIHKSLGDNTLPPEVQKELESLRCGECAATVELPRKPKMAMPAEATPNIVVSLDFMQHKIRSKSTDILVMMDHGDMLIRLKVLPDGRSITAFNVFYSRWI